MSRLVRSEGLVLRSQAFRESSKIVTVFTRKSGRVDLLARGARKPGSRFGAGLEIGTEAEFIYYERENRSLWTLSSVDILSSHQILRENPLTLSTLARILKLLSYLSQPGELNTGLYNLTLSVLNSLGTTEVPETIYDLFIWRATALSGYPPHIAARCLVCGKPGAVNFSVAQGGFLCPDHSHGKDIFRLAPEDFRALVRLTQASVSEIEGKLPPVLSRLIRDYARYHLHTDERLIPNASI